MPSAMGPITLVVLQSTGFCNIDCAYCYLPDRGNPRQCMEFSTVARAARLIFESGLVKDHVDIVWHAGEPMTLPASYYAKAIELIETAKPAGVTVHYGFQTNGTLINDAWIDLFERHAINVGVSLDGPRDLHDRNRNFRSGEGSHDRVVAGIAKLQARKYPFHFIGVVTSATLPRAAELLRYYWSFRPTNIGLNIDELEAENRQSSMSSGRDRDVRGLHRRASQRGSTAGRSGRHHSRFPAHDGLADRRSTGGQRSGCTAAHGEHRFQR